MLIGIPKETKTAETRVALTPAACAELIEKNHSVYLETNAGKASGFEDEAYQAIGVSIVENAKTLYAQAKLIVKVKEPTEQDLVYLTKEHILFCYLHLAANKGLAQKLQAIGVIAIPFETVEINGVLPLLAPMSAIAGRLSVHIGLQLLHSYQGGNGVLLGGIPGTLHGHVTILGGGVAGSYAAQVAAALNAEVTVFDINPNKLTNLYNIGANVSSLYSYKQNIIEILPKTDLLIGAVLIPGKKAPYLIKKEDLQFLKKGSVIVDIAVDQGGCIETIKPTTYKDPTYIIDNIVHFGVTNMPAAVPATASQALSNAIIPYVMLLAEKGLEDVVLQKALRLQQEGLEEY